MIDSDDFVKNIRVRRIARKDAHLIPRPGRGALGPDVDIKLRIGSGASPALPARLRKRRGPDFFSEDRRACHGSPYGQHSDSIHDLPPARHPRNSRTSAACPLTFTLG